MYGLNNLILDQLTKDAELCKLLLERQTFGWNWWTTTFGKDGGYMEFSPEKKICCDEELENSLYSKAAHLYTIQGFCITEVRVYCSTCKKCGITSHMDGRCYGLLNFGNLYLLDVGKLSLLFHSGLLYKLREMKVISGLPTNAWWKERIGMNLLSFSLDDPRREKFRKLWTGVGSRITAFLREFIFLLKYPDNHFRCCANPEVICADGLL